MSRFPWLSSMKLNITHARLTRILKHSIVNGCVCLVYLLVLPPFLPPHQLGLPSSSDSPPSKTRLPVVTQSSAIVAVRARSRYIRHSAKLRDELLRGRSPPSSPLFGAWDELSPVLSCPVPDISLSATIFFSTVFAVGWNRSPSRAPRQVHASLSPCHRAVRGVSQVFPVRALHPRTLSDQFERTFPPRERTDSKNVEAAGEKLLSRAERIQEFWQIIIIIVIIIIMILAWL